MPVLEFWYEFGSTYTYLAVARLRRTALAANVEVKWKPFLLYPILVKQGMTQGPFRPYPNKLSYMWRDIERRANEHGIPFQKPEIYPPMDVLTTARIAWLASRDGWVANFTEEVFRLHWTEGIPIGSEENIHNALRASGQLVSEVLERTQSIETKAGFKAQTELAEQKGIFGSPTFIVNDELFWGDDRLEQALLWANQHGSTEPKTAA